MTSQLDTLVGREIDGYEIEKLLGKGGMARVYRARDSRLGRYVAIKMIEPDARADPEYTRRFEIEARAVAQLQHPNIVSIYRFGEIDGLYYMAMHYVEGVDLAWVLTDYANDKELMPYDDVLRVVSQVGSALDYAHGKGVIHRDIKPSNVMLDPEGRAVLTDFGLALMQAEGTRGEVFGTPHYIAPEQAVSSAGSVPQSDQYSLGVMLYEMLTGSVPYEGNSAMDIAMAHMTEPLPSPLERNPDLNPALVKVLETVLAKEPEGRYASCKALAQDLERAMTAQSRMPSTVQRMSMLGVSEQVKAFREAHPLPPLPAPAVTEEAEKRTPAPPTKKATNEVPAQTTTPSTAQRPQNQTWLMVAAASVGIVIIGLLAILFLLSNRNNGTSPTPTAQVALNTAPTQIPIVVENTPVPTATLTETQPLPTLTPTLSPEPPTLAPTTAVPVSSPQNYLLTIHKRGEDSLFVVNSTTDAFPLTQLRLGDGDGAVRGSDWGVELLDNRACVAIWKDKGKPKAPDDVNCTQVGSDLTRGGKDIFWKDEFYVYYGEVLVEICREDRCIVAIVIP
jgi:serine/threonine protein kinase